MIIILFKLQMSYLLKFPLNYYEITAHLNLLLVVTCLFVNLVCIGIGYAVKANQHLRTSRGGLLTAHCIALPTYFMGTLSQARHILN